MTDPRNRDGEDLRTPDEDPREMMEMMKKMMSRCARGWRQGAADTPANYGPRQPILHAAGGTAPGMRLSQRQCRRNSAAEMSSNVPLVTNFFEVRNRIAASRSDTMAS